MEDFLYKLHLSGVEMELNCFWCYALWCFITFIFKYCKTRV